MSITTKDIAKLSDKELVNEINSIENTIEVCAISKRDLILQDWLWNEAENRGLDINKTTKYELSE